MLTLEQGQGEGVSVNFCHFLPQFPACNASHTLHRRASLPGMKEPLPLLPPPPLEQDAGSFPFCFSPLCQNAHNFGNTVMFYQPPALPD